MQSPPVQYVINTFRSHIYPWVYGNGSFEADNIVDNLWLGNWASAYDKDALKKMGITHILSAVYDISPTYPDDFKYMKIPVIDRADHAEHLSNHFDEAVEFIQDGLEEGGVLVHCVYGVSRSSTLVCAYLMRCCNMDARGAVNFVKTKRTQAKPNDGFLTTLHSAE